MRMLFLTTRFPFPPIGGEKLRPFHFIKHLSKNWKITLVSFVESDIETRQVENCPLKLENTHTVSLPRIRSYINCLGGLFSKTPLEIPYYTSQKMHQLLQREVQTNKYDLIFCHLIRMAPYVEKITGIKKVLDMCDALSFRYGLSYQLRKGPSKLIELIESKRLANYESKISEKFDLNLIASIKDKTYLEQKVGAKGLTVVENGVDLEACEYSQVQTDYKKIVFFGNLRTFHNIDAVQYFYKEIFPLVKQKIQEARFVIIGACVPRCILKMAKDRSVSILSEVENMHPHISDACVSVAPMRIAVGVQNKILQSMASKIPVVTTTLGLGGLQARAGQDILVADNPRDFADKVILLMRNRPTGDSIRQDAYRLIRERYLWPDVVDKLNKLLMHIV